MQVVNVFATSLLMFIIHPICNPFGYISPENCITLSLKLILRFHLSKKDVGQDEEKHQKKRGKLCRMRNMFWVWVQIKFASPVRRTEKMGV